MQNHSSTMKHMTESFTMLIMVLAPLMVLLSHLKSAGGRTEVLHKLLHGEAPPRGPPLTFLYAILTEKGTPFVYLPLIKGTQPFTCLLKVVL